MIRTIAVSLSIWFAIAGSANAGAPDGVTERWYTSDQVVQGQKLFAIHCADCHGKAAQGAALWKTQDRDGHFPPPPLNGTAHTWHHQLPLLRTIVRTGSVTRGGKMPAFADKLSTVEIDAVIAWLQSLWPDDVYLRWRGAGKPQIPMPDIIRDLLPEEAR